MKTVEKFQEDLGLIASALSLEPTEDGPDSELKYVFDGSLAGADEETMKKTFGFDLREEDRAGEFSYARGPKALKRYLEHVVIAEWAAEREAHERGIDPSEISLEKLPGLLDNDAIKDIHFVGSWTGDEWGVAGYAHWNSRGRVPRRTLCASEHARWLAVTTCAFRDSNSVC